MRVKFDGVVEEKRSGCGGCGRRTSKKRFVRIKDVYMPNGTKRTFRAGVFVDVTDEDAVFLLALEGFSRE